MFKLYNAARSSASYRVRIALAYKGLPFEYVPVDLLKGGQFEDAFRRRNPQELVPMLQDGDHYLTQSLAIIEFLEERYPQPPLLPHVPRDRAYVRAAALAIACEIHPLNNLRVLRYLVRELGASEERKNGWYRHWVEQGLAQLEALLVAQGRTGRYVFGDQVTIADVCLVPQIFNARRFDCRLDHVPTVMRIFEACMQLPAFENTRPERQPDFVP
ncbi:MAG: maleylacetoacetate isomerase [Sutterellaceae bacterium]|nr:maleylacetoacetate isomerase [Burkholderiaceae bacterium]MCX7901422.1 maleylacetoacetate isomerase [Burkholderiaceae bacterium]MDW8429701.1 maleylacetoacetate isomerase [Sutterellaceae bacterium]